jgi:acyl-CoA thioester hydrolase
MNWDYPAPHCNELLVGDHDIDGMGHTNNACYISWCEQVAWSHSAELGLTIADYQQLDRGVAIRQASYDYYLPSFSGDKLLIGTWLTHCDGKLRLQRRFQLIKPASGQTILRGCWDLVGIRVSTGKPSRFPEEFLRCYGAAVVDSKKNQK